MPNLALVRTMILKEIRTTFRERSQLRGLIVSVVVIVIALSSTMSKVHPGEMGRHPATTTQAKPAVPQDAAMETWVAIGGCAFAGFFFSVGYLISATLSSFVGEKEGRTLEVLLASPLSDGRLFAVKGMSVLIPSVGVGCLFAGILGGLGIGYFHIAEPSARLILLTIVCAPPLMMLAQLWFVGLGAAISVRAETLKGAAQGMSVVFMVLMFGGIYGVPLLMRNFPNVQATGTAYAMRWLSLPFLAQYGSVIVAMGIVAAICLGLGRAAFRRDRMLT